MTTRGAEEEAGVLQCSPPVEIKLDPLEETVRQLWLKHAGIGIQDLCLEVKKLLPPPWPNKKRVKAAKAVIPYLRLPDSSDTLTTNTDTNTEFDSQKQTFVKQKLEQRQSLRIARDFTRADRIEEGLSAMGISIDDTNKTWTRGPPKTDMPNLVEFESSNSGRTEEDKDKNGGVPCSFCGRMFESRNLMFKHLRDLVSGCGTSIFASGQAIAEPPSLIQKQHKRIELRAAAASANGSNSQRNTGTTARHASAKACLWIGDLPLKWTRAGGRYKRIRALLYAYTPNDVPRPWIKTVVRKAYRRRRDYASTTNSDDVDNNQIGASNDPYLGYVIVVYRDAAEAVAVLSAMNGITVSLVDVYTPDELQSKRNDLTDLLLDTEPPFFLKVRAVENSDTSAAAIPEPWLDHRQTIANKDEYATNNSKNTNSAPLSPGLDPPYSEQLRPLATDELLRRAAMNQQIHHVLKAGIDTHTVGNNHSLIDDEKANHSNALLLAMSAYKDAGRLPRREVRQKGRIVPKPILDSLLQLLHYLRWPVPNQRQGLSAERYLVLPTNITNDLFYSELRHACRVLMEWAAPGYYYSGIAVTKNLVASPHTDDRDQSYQFAMSLGYFTSGGELCVEGGAMNYEYAHDCNNGTAHAIDDWVNVVETRNRIARVDGRHVHWVRPWVGGDRYSLIFYDTSDRQPTPVNYSGVYTDDFDANESDDFICISNGIANTTKSK